MQHLWEGVRVAPSVPRLARGSRSLASLATLVAGEREIMTFETQLGIFILAIAYLVFIFNTKFWRNHK